MNTPQYQELLNAVDLLRQYPGATKELDYTLYSVKLMDYLLADSYQNGKLRKPDGKFAKYQGRLTLGIAGYITQVILKNSNNTKVEIDPTDEKWYLHFKVVGETGYEVQPAQLVLKRTLEGHPAALHTFILSSITKFNYPKIGLSEEIYSHEETNKKSWWKFW
jgi:hypothetical protein